MVRIILTSIGWSESPASLRAFGPAIAYCNFRLVMQEMFMALLHHSLGRHDMADQPALSAPARSGASIFAIIAALASFYFSSQGRELWGLFAAILAIAAGMLGGVKALSPSVRGGLLSIAAVVLGLIAIIAALIALVV